MATVNASLTGQPTPPLRKHVVEFIRGTGVVTDGVVDVTSTTGPWNWTMPACFSPDADMAGGGGGGAGGGSPTGGGGGGGGSGFFIVGHRLPFIAGTVLQIAVGQAGTGGVAGAAGTIGGDTTITVGGARWKIALGSRATAAQPGGAANGGNGGASGSFGAGGAGGVGAAGANPPNATQINVSPSHNIVAQAGCGGGAVNFSGGTTGSLYALASTYGTPTAATGNASNGGGGHGAQSVFGTGSSGGFGGLGGNGGSPGSSPQAGNYGAGGGGGGGGAAGAAGADGYVRITYYSQD